MEQRDDSDSLVRYIDVLLDTYPTGINQRELAQRAGVSEPAVSNIKERLYEFTVKDKFPFHEILLSTESPVLTRIGWLLLTNKMFSRLVTSRYGRAVLEKFDIHGKISIAYPSYVRFFSQNDTNLMVGTLIANLSALDKIGKLGRRLTTMEEKLPLLTVQAGKVLGEVLANFKVSIKNERDLIAWLGIRDRWYFLVESTLYDKSLTLSILSQVDDKEIYIRVYRGTISYYLKRMFVPITEYLQRVAQEQGVRFDSRYLTVGSVFAPLKSK